MPTRALLADALLLLHAAFVVFVVGGLAAVWIGARLGRPFARDPRFRLAHLAAIAFVAVQSVLGFTCPLTIWEDALRGTATDAGWIERWVRSLLYWELPRGAFTAIYVAFAGAVMATWWLVPPRRRGERPSPRD